jgi:DNA-3-methyladenine glycosylase II
VTARLIQTEADLREGAAWLRAAEPAFRAAPDPPLRRRPGGFAGLLRIVMGQQVSVAAAEAIWGRLHAAGGDSAEGLARLDDAALRACGLSAQKARYARAIAAADIDFAALADAPQDEAIAALTAIKGVGRWTAEIYLMFCVGRADVFAPGDLALQEGARLLLKLPERPGPRPLEALARDWSPWRAVAARMLWAHYAACKRREGIAP